MGLGILQGKARYSTLYMVLYYYANIDANGEERRTAKALLARQADMVRLHVVILFPRARTVLMAIFLP